MKKDLFLLRFDTMQPEKWSVLGNCTVTFGKWFPPFRKNAVP